MKNIDAKTFSGMIISGANNLANNKTTVNELNVFPVPDGDTGTNMSMTVSAVAEAMKDCRFSNISAAAKLMANSSLRGARGNSGVILSQFMRGMSKTLKGCEVCDAGLLALALKEGSDTAYRAVMNPTEGTILTVAREAANGALFAQGEDIRDMMRSCVSRGNKTLKKTMRMLPALKKAGVVDAGGQGWMYILEGMLYYLENGKEVELSQIGLPSAKPVKEQNEKTEHKTEDIKFGYCTEFIVEKKEKANVLLFRNSIETLGDCMLVIDDDEIVKVHIHTNHPGTVMENALKMGSLINIKIDNMRHQHGNIIEEAKNLDNDTDKPKEEMKKYGFAAVVSGDGFADILKDLNVDEIITGGQTMNPSTEDILNAADKINAECIFVFPNNKNIIMAAESAREISDKKIIVIPTKTIPESIAAMLEFNEDVSEDENRKSFERAAERVKTAQVTYAVRDVSEDGIKEGDFIGIIGSEIKISGSSRTEVTEGIIDKLTDKDTEFLTIYCGEGSDEKEISEIAENFEEKYEDTEVSVKFGGQNVYCYVIAAE